MSEGLAGAPGTGACPRWSGARTRPGSARGSCPCCSPHHPEFSILPRCSPHHQEFSIMPRQLSLLGITKTSALRITESSPSPKHEKKSLLRITKSSAIRITKSSPSPKHSAPDRPESGVHYPGHIRSTVFRELNAAVVLAAHRRACSF